MGKQRKRGLTRRKILAASSLLPLAWAPTLTKAQPTSLKVGLLLAQTGFASFEGTSAGQGFELFLEQNGGKLGGMPVQTQKEDEQGKADVGLTKARQLIEQAKVDLIVGPVTSTVALAIRDYVTQQKVPVIVPVAVADDLTRTGQASPYVYRVQVTGTQANRPFGEWVYDHLKYRKMILVGLDYSAGRDSMGAFKAGFIAKGGEIASEILIPIGTPDQAPFLNRIRPGDVDAVYAWVAGADAIRFVKQWQEIGLQGKIPLVGFAGITEDVILPEVKDAAIGHVVVTPYTANIDNEINHKFVAAYRRRYGVTPALPAANGYIAGQVLDTAIHTAGGVGDKEALLAALAKTAIDTPRDPIEFDGNRQVICDLFIARAEKVGDHVENRVIDIIRKMRQPA